MTHPWEETWKHTGDGYVQKTGLPEYGGGGYVVGRMQHGPQADLTAAAPELYRMLADCAEHVDMICMCGTEDAGGEVITPDQCWQCRIQAALKKARGE